MNTKKSSKDVVKKATSKKSTPKKNILKTGETYAPSKEVVKASQEKASSVLKTGKSTSSSKAAPIKRIRNRFSEADEKDIVKMYKSKAKYSEIAAKYNSPQSSIYMVLVRQKAIVPKPRKKK